MDCRGGSRSNTFVMKFYVYFVGVIAPYSTVCDIVLVVLCDIHLIEVMVTNGIIPVLSIGQRPLAFLVEFLSGRLFFTEREGLDIKEVIVIVRNGSCDDVYFHKAKTLGFPRNMVSSGE